MTSTHEADTTATIRTVRQWRLLRGLTHRQFAASCGLALSTVQQAENGTFRPQAPTIAALARGLAVRPEQIREIRQAVGLDGEGAER